MINVLDHKVALIGTGVALVLGGIGYLVRKRNPELFKNLTEPVINPIMKGAHKVKEATTRHAHVEAEPEPEME